MVALGVALAAWVLRLLVELTCAPWLDVCRRGSQMLGFLYSIILVGLAGLGYFHRAATSRYLGFLAPVGKQVAAAAVASLQAAMGAAASASAAGGGGGGGSGRGLVASRQRSAGAVATATAAEPVVWQDGGDDDQAGGDGGETPPTSGAQPHEPQGGLAGYSGVRRRR